MHSCSPDALAYLARRYAYHSSASAFARDRRRDAALTAAGFRVTWPDIVSEPEASLVRLAQALAC